MGSSKERRLKLLQLSLLIELEFAVDVVLVVVSLLGSKSKSINILPRLSFGREIIKYISVVKKRGIIESDTEHGNDQSVFGLSA